MRDGVLKVGVIGRQNAGKTLLLEQLVAAWSERGLHVAVLKHDGHAEQLQNDWEKAGSDTARVAQAGACATMVAGGGASLLRLRDDPDTRDPDALARRVVELAAATGVQIDVVAAEGWKHSGWNMVAVIAHHDDLQWLAAEQVDHVRAIYCAEPLAQVAASGPQVYHYPHIRRLADDMLIWQENERPGSR